MELISLFIFFIVFLFIGSFLGVLVDRIYRGEQFVSGSSYCEHCKHKLEVLDLIPVFSYLFLNGKCRYCKSPIPNSLPLIEILASIILTSIVYIVDSHNFLFLSPIYMLAVLVTLLIGGIFMLIFFTDAKYMVIPDIYLYLLVLLYPFYFWLYKSIGTFQGSLPILKDDLAAAIILALFFAALHYGSHKKAMGEGDIYLSAIIGLYLGTQLSVVMAFMAFLLGALFGITLMYLGKKKMKSAIAFGPFLIIGMLVALIFGADLINWYLSF